MTEIDIERVKEASGCSELWELIKSYQGYRPGPDGPATKVLISIYKSDEARWCVEATDEAGRTATGNGEPDIDTALASTHWDQLDR